jgi:hypothetical protein
VQSNISKFLYDPP